MDSKEITVVRKHKVQDLENRGSLAQGKQLHSMTEVPASKHTPIPTLDDILAKNHVKLQYMLFLAQVVEKSDKVLIFIEFETLNKFQPRAITLKQIDNAEVAKRHAMLRPDQWLVVARFKGKVVLVNARATITKDDVEFIVTHPMSAKHFYNRKLLENKKPAEENKKALK
jgi:hypothetical protein